MCAHRIVAIALLVGLSHVYSANTTVGDVDQTRAVSVPTLNVAPEPFEVSNDTRHEVALSQLDRRYITYYHWLLDEDSLSGTHLQWRNAGERFYFYAKLIMAIQDDQEGVARLADPSGIVITDKDEVQLLPIPNLKRNIAITCGRLLQYANEFEKIASDSGILQIIGGSLGIVGGVLSATGLILAPLTAGGSLLLTGASVALGAIGSTLLLSAAIGIPGEVVSSVWEQHYMSKCMSEARQTMSQIDLLAGIVTESTVAFRDFDEFLSHDPELQGAMDGMIWAKNVYVTLMKGITMSRIHEKMISSGQVKLPSKVQIMKDVVKEVKGSVRAAWKNLDSYCFSISSLSNPQCYKIDKTKSFSQNVKQLISGSKIKFKQNYALDFAASGVRVPWFKNSKLIWKSLVKAGSKVAITLSSIGSAVSIAGGIWSVLIGAGNIKGSGILSDRIRSSVYDIELYSSRTLELYDTLRLRNGTSDQVASYKMLTGIEIHTCWHFDAQTDSPMFIEIQSGNATCFSNVLDTPAHNDLEVNQWDVYTNPEVLGACSGFIVADVSDTRARFVNAGGGAHCGDYINLQVDFLDKAFATCHIEEGIWTDYSMSDWIHCHDSPDISRIDIYPCLSDYAGTDSDVRLGIRSGDNLCITNPLDNNGNDLARGSMSTYRQDILGTCKDVSIGENDIQVNFLNSGYDDLCVGLMLMYIKNAQMKKDEVFKCDFPVENRIEYESTPFHSCSKFHLDHAKALSAIRPIICDDPDAGSTTNYYSGVHFEICSTRGCCQTNYLDVLYHDELTQGSSRIFSQPGVMGRCYGFEMDASNMSYSLINTNEYDNICITGVELFALDSNNLYPHVKCSAPGGKLWAHNETKGPYPCDDFLTTQVSQIELKVCDEMLAGTDSPLGIQICRNGFQDCCSSGILDQPGEDDFEQGDFALYSGSQLGSCSNFSIHADIINLSVVNHGSNGVCFLSVNVRTMSGNVLRCYIPHEIEYWVHRGSMDLRCQKI